MQQQQYFEHTYSHKSTLKKLLPYFWPKGLLNLKVRVVSALICLILAKIVNVYVPFLYKFAVDALNVKTTLIAVPVGVILAYGGARALTQLFSELRDLLFVYVAQDALRKIALSTFKHLHSLSLAFHLNRQTGALSRIIERGTNGVSFILSFMLFNILPTILEVLLVTAILFFKFNIWFSIITFSFIVIYIVFTFAITEWRLQFRRKMNKKENEANSKAIDSLLNYETVKYFTNEAYEAKRYDNSLKGYQKAAISNQKSLSFLNLGQNIIIAIGLTSVMLMAAYGVKNGTMTLGDFVLINTFMLQLYIPLGFLGFVYRQMKQSFVDMDNMLTLLDVKADIQDKENANPLKVTAGQVQFKQVDFDYHHDRKILKDINFELPAGKTIAIVGPSGSGKSTILRLLFRFYDVNAGEILIDGQNIKEHTQSSLRQAISIVPQDCVLFNDTIAYNIQYGNIHATYEDIEHAAKLAQIHEFITRLPNGYATRVGERGLKLSGGEKQRVAIARALIKNPKILVFDEATSSLDSETEKEIQVSIRKVARGISTLIIAHRLSTVVDANEILVLSAGHIVERGNHEQLLARKGHYAKMWQRQQKVIKYQEKLEETLAKPLPPLA